jgi:hypothetical protein
MYDECPPLTLMPELTALEPRVMLLLGRTRVRNPVRELLRREANLEWGASPGSLERDGFTLGNTPCTLFCLNHPSTRDARRWQDSLDQLVEQLIAQPVTLAEPHWRMSRSPWNFGDGLLSEFSQTADAATSGAGVSMMVWRAMSRSTATASAGSLG